ncbi:hypothetical protein [uncultured Williamsia sp.]|uniref:hypothetical protein n=1 Tax=uncultured Williamsia sp. TaxID=259311 RepID=UPI0026241FBE|nr:hypothetical protein [uncultured Williamsia sp.]
MRLRSRPRSAALLMSLISKAVASRGRMAAAASAVAGSGWTDQRAGSTSLAALKAHGDKVSSVQYTVIETRTDTVVRPFPSAFLTGDDVPNVLVQDRCRANTVDHGGMAFDPYTLGLVLHALDPATTSAPCR